MNFKRYKSQNDIDLPIVRQYMDLYKLTEKFDFKEGDIAYVVIDKYSIDYWNPKFPNGLCYECRIVNSEVVWAPRIDDNQHMCFVDFKPKYSI
jgi:hypothetical protein